MRIHDAVRRQLATRFVRFEVLLPHLNERQQRLALATEARLLGRGEATACTDRLPVRSHGVGALGRRSVRSSPTARVAAAIQRVV